MIVLGFVPQYATDIHGDWRLRIDGRIARRIRGLSRKHTVHEIALALDSECADLLEDFFAYAEAHADKHDTDNPGKRQSPAPRARGRPPTSAGDP